MLSGSAFLLGDQPLLCDFAVTAQLHYLSRTPVGERALAARPVIGAYRDRMKALRETTRSAPRATAPMPA
jgi:glutathione S-transferase